MSKNAYLKEIRNMPLDLDRTVLRILTYHVGRKQSIGRLNLVLEVRKIGYAVVERQVRETIHELRRQGFLICSAPGADGGYYIAENRQEYLDFKQAEFDAKITDMAETVRAMDAAASDQFGDAVQIRML
jgi:hypothetical protein